MKFNIGYLTLRRIGPLKNINGYLLGEIFPYISGEDILEIGSGIGTYTESFLKAGKNVTSIDTIPQINEMLRKRFGHRYPTFGFITGDISDDTIVGRINKKFDTIVCLNVLEHVRDDEKAMSNMRRLIKADGRLILQVPALKFLYGTLDKNLGHYRRYTLREIKDKMRDNGFSVDKHFYLYFAGIFGWYIRSHITKNVALGKQDLKVFNALLFLFKLIDRITFKSIGQSLIVIGTAK